MRQAAGGRREDAGRRRRRLVLLAGIRRGEVVLADRGRCRQGAFFHMQEWKKRWGDGNANVDARAAHDRFVLSQDGIHELRVDPAMLDAGWVGV